MESKAIDQKDDKCKENVQIQTSKGTEGCVVVSCADIDASSIVHKIIGVDVPREVVSSYIERFPWSFSNKYYSAEIYLYTILQKQTLDPDFCGFAKAIVIHFDSEKKSSFDDVLQWMALLDKINAEVQILICENLSDECESENVPSRKQVLDWCIENQFELIEVKPSQDEDDGENFFNGATGYERVKEALQSHTWANLVMTDEKTSGKEISGDSAICENIIENVPETLDGAQRNGSVRAENQSTPSASAKSTVTTMKVDSEELSLDEKLLENVLQGEDPGGESFEALFAKFANMKDRASNLSGEDRKKYAEKVAIAFWKAMGGDEDEIDGLDDN